MDDKLNKLLILLCRSISNRKIYFSNHPKINQHSREFIAILREFLHATDQDSLFIGIVEGNIIYDGRNLIGPSIIGRQLVDFTTKMHCGGITFNHQVSVDEILELLSLATDLTKPVSSLGEARDLLRSKGVENIQIAAHYSGNPGLATKDQKVSWQGKDATRILANPAMIYQALFDVVSSAHGNASVDRTLDIDTTRTVSEHLVKHTRTSFSDMMQQIQYPDFDTYTVGHSVRVATLAVFFGTKLNLPENTLLEIGSAGLLHDLGKSKIPEEILFKPGKLTSEEFSVIKKHAQLGVSILLAQKESTEMDIAGAWGHHIRHDGKGYPKQPSWAVRHPLTAMLQICDVFEALTAIRPYKPPLSPQEAFSIMLADKGAFHPALLAAFISSVGLYPPGNTVTLSDDRKGRVLSVGKTIDRPKVEITHSKDGKALDHADFYTIDLQSPPTKDISITELILD